MTRAYLPADIHDAVGIVEIGIPGFIFIVGIDGMAELVRRGLEIVSTDGWRRLVAGIIGGEIVTVELNTPVGEIDIAAMRVTRPGFHGHNPPVPRWSRDPVNVKVDGRLSTAANDEITTCRHGGGRSPDGNANPVAPGGPDLLVHGVVEILFLFLGPERHGRLDLPIVQPVLLEKNAPLMENNVDCSPRLIGDSVWHDSTS